MDTPDVSIIIPTYQRRELVSGLVRSLEKQRFEGSFEVIVVVDGSTDGTTEALQHVRVPFALRVLQQPNLGLSRTRNRGASLATGGILLFLDDDMEPDPQLLAEHLRTHRSGAEVVLGRIPLHPESPDNLLSQGVGKWATGLSERLADPDWQPEYDDLIGGHISVRKEVFEATGGFDERFNPEGAYGAEDVELGYRLIAAGRRIVFNPDAVCYQRYVVDARTHLRQNRQVGHSDVAIVRKHPGLHDRTFAYKTRTSEIHRILWRPVVAFPRLAGFTTTPLRWVAVRRVLQGRRDRLTALLFFSVRSVEYWRGVSEAGGIPRPRPVRVLAYHAIADLSGDPVLEQYGIPLPEFEGQLDALRRAGYRFIEPLELVNMVQEGGGVPRKAVLMTFDDCYRDLLDVALPSLQERGVPAVAFAVTGRLGGSNDWDRAIGARPLPLLDAEDLGRLYEAGVEIGAHSRTHRMLPRVSNEELGEEIGGSLDDLASSGLGRLRLFAYPGGEHDHRVRSAVRRAGVRAAFTVDPGRALPNQDFTRIPRIEVLRRDTGARFRLKVALAGREPRLIPRARRAFRRLRRALE